MPTDEVEVQLTTIAKELAAGSQARLLQTTAEIAELEEQLRQLRTQRDGQLNAYKRLDSYRPRAAAVEYLCPNCWVSEGQSIPLKPILLGRPEDDVLRCPACGRDFGISLRVYGPPTARQRMWAMHRTGSSPSTKT